MKKNTKTTLKVLSGIALAGTVAVLTDGNADAKTYKPEVRYQDGKYFVKTSDPATKGKLMAFSVKKPNSDEFLRISDEVNYNNQEVVIKKGFDEQFEGEITDNTVVAIQDEEKRPNGSEDAIDNPEELAKYKQEEKAFFAEAKAGGVTFKDAMKKEEKLKEETKTAVTSTLAERFIDSLKGEVTPEGKVVYTFKSKEPLSYNDHIRTSLSLFNDKTGDATTHIQFHTEDGINFTGTYDVKNLEEGVWKPYNLSFTDSNGMPQDIKRQDLISYDKKAQVFIGLKNEEPIGSPQLQGKKVGVFANYKKVKKGTVVKYTIRTNDKDLRDDNILLVRNGDTYFDHNASRFTLEYDSKGNRVIYVRTENLEPGIYNVIKIDGKDITKLEDIYNGDGWFEVGNEDIRREGPAVSDTVPTTKPDETPKPTPEPQPGKDETPKPTPEPKPGKDEKPKPGKEETPKPSETSKPGRDSNWNPFAQGQKAKEGSTEVKSEAGEVATKPVSNRKEGKALPNTGLQTTSYGFLAAIVGLFGAVALRRKNK